MQNILYDPERVQQIRDKYQYDQASTTPKKGDGPSGEKSDSNHLTATYRNIRAAYEKFDDEDAPGMAADPFVQQIILANVLSQEG